MEFNDDNIMTAYNQVLPTQRGSLKWVLISTKQIQLYNITPYISVNEYFNIIGLKYNTWLLVGIIVDN